MNRGRAQALGVSTARDLPRAIKVHVAVHAQLFQNFFEPGQNVSQTALISRRRFRKGHSTCAAARARADVESFQNGHGLFGREQPQPGR